MGQGRVGLHGAREGGLHGARGFGLHGARESGLHGARGLGCTGGGAAGHDWEVHVATCIPFTRNTHAQCLCLA